jgi:uncharacterized membrane protein YphA (DoxX/SURF4 family)
MAYTDVAWLALRGTYAWLLLVALISLLKDPKGMTDAMRPMFPIGTSVVAAFMFLMMGTTALMILLGVWAQIAGWCMVVFNLMGVKFHLSFAKQAKELAKANPDQEATVTCAALAVVGHTTSAQKNIVLAGAGLFFAILGTGPWSLTEPFYWGMQ